MSYTAPDWASLDFSTQPGPYTAPDWSALNFSSAGASGNLTATLGFTSSFSGVVTVGGDLTAELDFSAAFAGEISNVSGSLNAVLDFTPAISGYQDWLSSIPPVQLQEVYRLIITGYADNTDDLVIGQISSWQATNQAGGRSAYLQAVIPAAEQYLADIEARQNGDLVIEKGYRLADGTVTYSEILRSDFDELRPDRGQVSLTITVSGYRAGKPVSNGTRTLTGIRSTSLANGKRRVRCDIDLFLQPGMTVNALEDSFAAGYINYYVTQADKFCEVGER